MAIREYATGALIANFDDDDVYLPAYLSSMVKILKSSQAALVHLSAWSVLDVRAAWCGVFDAVNPLPSAQEASSLSGRSGFSFVYTQAAWRSLPWPSVMVGEDLALLRGFSEVGLPVASVSEKHLLSTVFHVQHGRNLCGSVCHLMREDVDFVSTVLSRFETACRRIIGVSQAEYDQAGGHGLLHCGLGAMKFGPGPPSNSVFLCADQGAHAYDEWRQSS